MRNICYILLNIGFAIIINSCEYNPIGEYERVADENVASPEIQVLDLNIDQDTIFLYSGYNVAFNFKSSAQNIKNVKFTIDGKEAYNNVITSGILYLNYGEMDEGNHSLLLEIVTESGSGSIADLLGAEGFLFSKSWILVVDKSYNSKTTATAHNGFLTLAWPKYRKSDFSEYIITRDIGSMHEVELDRTALTEFIDKSYVGEGVSYYVKVSTSDGKIIPWGHTYLKPELPALSVSSLPSHQYVVNWGKFKYYNAVKSFNLSQTTDYEYSYETLKITNDYSDSITIIPDAYFGDKVYLKLNIIPGGNNIMYNPDIPDNHLMFETRLVTYTGTKFIDDYIRLEEIFQVSSTDFVSCDGSKSLLRYSVQRKTFVDRMTYQPLTCSGAMFIGLSVSPAGKYLTSLYHLCDRYAMLIPSENLNNYTLHNLNSITFSSALRISDIGTAIANSTNSGFYIYDLKTNTALAHYNKTGVEAQGINISTEGDYIFLTDDSLRLVKFNGSSFTKIWSDAISNIPEYLEFDGTNPEQIAVWDGEIFSIRRCSNYSSVYEFPLTDSLILNIDYFNKKLLTYTPGTPGHLYIRDYINGHIISTVPVNIQPIRGNQIVYLINNAIVGDNGFLEYY